MQEYATDRVTYDRVFGKFEILMSLVSMDVSSEGNPESATKEAAPVKPGAEQVAALFFA